MYYGRKCASNLDQKLQFWADLNRDIFEYALNHLGAHQYVAVRVEDLVLGNRACYDRLAAFIGLSPAEAAARVPKAIEANRGHESSYLGNKWNDKIKSKVERVVSHSSRARPQFSFWGYEPEKYAFSVPCEEMPWLKQMRAKKGPLPGDKDYDASAAAAAAAAATTTGTTTTSDGDSS